MPRDQSRFAPAVLPTGGRLQDLPLETRSWRLAMEAFLGEDYQRALELVRHALETVPSQEGIPVALVPDQDRPTVKDGVLLCARCLFQLDHFADFEVLHASAGRWGLVPADMPALDVVLLAFACKRGEYRQAVQEATDFIERNRRDLHPAVADYLYLRGMAYSHLGQPQLAREDAEAAFSLFKVLGKDLECGRAANLMGILALRSSDFMGASLWFDRALQRHTALTMKKNMGGNRLNLGIAAYKRGRFPQALQEFRQARDLLTQVDGRVSLCRLDIAEGNTLRLLRDFAGARARLLPALDAAGTLQLSREEALALEFLGDVARDEGRLDQARRFYSRALTVAASIAPDGDIVMEVLRRQGECLALLGRQAEAVPVLRRALGMTRRLGDLFEEGAVCRVMADTLLALGDLDSGLHYGRRAVAVLKDVGADHELAQAFMVSARALCAKADSGLETDPQGKLEQSWQDAMAALDLALKMDIEYWILAARRLLGFISNRKLVMEQSAIAAGRSGPGAAGKGRAEVPPIIHVSSCIRDLIQIADAFAESGEPVLITGETGTGKELFARRLHQRSPRRTGNLVCVNVSAIPEGVFAREFFGHVRGSFTGADSDRAGLAAQADGGTLFLDEIGDLPLSLQPQLLRLLQEGTYQALGDPGERRADIRLIAATNADLKQRVAEGKFRADLFYRLKILELRIPPIAERREDILPLLRHFLSQAEGRMVDLRSYFNEASLDRIQCNDWPGNVREIAMVARQAKIQLASLGEVCIQVENSAGQPCFFTGPQVLVPSGDVTGALQSELPGAGPGAGRSRILVALDETAGNRAEAARRMGVSRSTLYRRMDKLGIAGKVTAS